MKSVQLIIVLILTLSLSVNGNNGLSTPDSNKSRVGIGLAWRTAFFDLDNLNNQLVENSYPLLNSYTFGFGGEFYMGSKTDRVYQTIAGCYYSQQQENDSNKVSILIYDFYSDLAFNVLKKKKIFLHPNLGFGFKTVSLKLYNSTLTTSNFSSALTNYSMSELYSKNLVFFLDVGVGFDLAFTKSDHYLLGTQVGYYIPLSKVNWESNGVKLYGVPDLNFKGLFSSLVLTVSL